MTSKNCKTCAKEFVIKNEDLVFYDKIKIPPPSFCPECRLRQRLVWRNEKSLYRRTCDLCKKQIISIYAPEKPYTVYCRECFHGDGWDPTLFAKDIEFSKPFLEQFRELQLQVPRISSFVFQNTQSEYVNGAAFNKNCYMIFVSDHNEDCMYSYATFNSRSSADLLNCTECETCYDCITCSKCYRVAFSEDCSASQDLLFCKNCVNCQDCIGCTNLRNIRYAIFNTVYEKEEYFKKAAELGLYSRTGIMEFEKQSEAFHSKFPVKYLHGLRNTNVSGDYVSNSKNGTFVFDSDELEDCKFINHGHSIKDSYDSYVLVDKSELVSQVVSGITLSNVQFGNCIWHGYNITYSDTCENSSNLMGCIGLRKKEYCILNKQYSKEEYEKLLPKIREHMATIPFIDGNGIPYTYGDFFPESFSPFAYNETVVQEYLPLSESEAQERGLPWRKEELRDYQPTIKTDSVPDTIEKVDDSITKEVIECSHKGNCADQCTTAFKLTQNEIDLYRKLNIPLPTLCFTCRHAQRTRKRNPRKLWVRTCTCDLSNHDHRGNCSNEFETSYAPERKEKVFCERCYQQEVM